MKFHLIGNSHIDPVWMWDWREGFNESLATVRAVLDLMDENKKLTYIRGESSVYRHIEETDPATFKRIVAYVRAGRWDIVGGTYCQPDDNLPSVETLSRQFADGQRYFQSRFGRTSSVAWQPDSFGHPAGYPEVLAAAGIRSFAFTRPDEKAVSLSAPAFWWEGESGARILAYRPMVGWYGTDPDEIARRLDGLLEAAKAHSLENVGCFYGLGNHGGGPSRRQLEDISDWMKSHPEIEVVHSGLHFFFEALRNELAAKGDNVIPVRRGELNFCLRGCYSSMAQFKALYRRAENMLTRAEKTDSVLAGALGFEAQDLTVPWQHVLFNSFHDIICGSSIERAYEDQVASLGETIHAGLRAEFRALNRLAMQVDTRVAAHPKHHPSAQAALIWNPHPQPYQGHVEVEVCLGHRPIKEFENRPAEVPVRVLAATGKAVPFQELRQESTCMASLPWRKRVLIPVHLPAFGWNVVQVGWVKDAIKPKVADPVLSGPDWIDNGEYRVEAKPGQPGIQLFHRGKAILTADGMGARTLDDPWGSWGAMDEDPAGIFLNKIHETWKIDRVQLVESGEQRATLWIRLAGEKSRIDLEFSLDRGRAAIDISARVLWTERSTRLKLTFPVANDTRFEVPGAVIKRKPCGEVPGGRWVEINSTFGLASNFFYNFDAQDGLFQATVLRATRYCDDVVTPAEEKPWIPSTDLGELKFRFVLTSSTRDLPRLARELEQPPIVVLVPAKKGKLPPAGSFGALEPASMELLALKRAAASGKAFILRAQQRSAKEVSATLTWRGNRLDLGRVRPGEIASWMLKSSGSRWKATRVNLAENPIKKEATASNASTKKRPRANRKR